MLPALWWALLAVCAICGVGTWWLRNFTAYEEMTKLVAFTGIATMISLVIWTWTLDI